MPEATRPPGVTFCVPNWNHRAYISRCLKSAVQAALKLQKADLPSEIIVVDDVSRDGSQPLLLGTAMMETRIAIDVLSLRANIGLGAARNLALGKARYRYICFLDADNELIAENIDIFYRSICATRAAVVYGNLIKHDGESCRGLLSNDVVAPALLEDNYIDAMTICDVAMLRAAGGFDAELKSHEDWDMWLHLLAEKKKIIFVPACFGYYYINPSSMVQTNTDVDFKRFHRIYNQRENCGIVPASGTRMYHPDIGFLN